MAHMGDVFEGKTLDAAVKKGLDSLGLSRAEVMITILEEGSGGFLGIGARPYRVRMSRRPGGPPVVDADERGRRGSGRDRRDRERGSGGGRSRDGGRGERRDRPRERGDERKRDERRGPAGTPVAGAPAGGPERRSERRDERPRDERPRDERPGERRPERSAERGERRPERGERRPERPGERGERRPERPGDFPEAREERRPERPAPPEALRPAADARDADELDGGEGRRRRRRGRRGGRRRHGEAGEGVGEAALRPRETDADRGPVREEPRVERAAAYAEPVSDRSPVYDEPPVERGFREEPPVERDFREEPPAARVEPARETERFEPPVRRESRERPERDYPREPRTEEFEGPGLSAEELAAQSTRLTEDLLKAMGFEAKVSATVDGNHVDVTAEVARDEDLLTGRKGEVRQALQHLLNRILNRGESSRYHLQLEINDFWKRREEELRELARSLADEAAASDGEVVTEYLNAQERRIVHVTLREDSRVKTYALGTGMIKRVAIAPSDFEGGPRDESD
jgi:predicted RNA-binding protein Jag